VPGLGASFGRGAATNTQQDMANSDCILIMGSNMAEAHPVGFRWPMKARERGATLIHLGRVDNFWANWVGWAIAAGS
jgi:formate dehydrogenase major subunit